MTYQLENEGDSRRLTFEVNALVGARSVLLPTDMVDLDLKRLGEPFAPAPFASVTVKGHANIAHIGRNADVSKVNLNVKGQGNRIIIGSNCNLKGTIGILGHGRIVFIGASTTFNNVAIVCKHHGHVYIGRDCMFSSGIEIRTSDSHAVVDVETMQVVNTPAGVFIGDHVWVGKRAVVQKGAMVADDNIVAMSAFVRGGFSQSRTVIAGTPAKVVRTGRTWMREEAIEPTEDRVIAWKSLSLL
jgi:acetyltransferase-like isoleucine patch superfamily enzyme